MTSITITLPIPIQLSIASMKTYPYHTPEGIIELVEQREYDEILKLALQLANRRAEDMATIKQHTEMISRLANALALITEEYEDRRFQFGDEYLWQKHEGNNPLPTAFAALDAYELWKKKTAMSDTPRTDDFIGPIVGIYMTEGEIAMCDFARQLERELNAVKAALSGRTVSCLNCNAMAEKLAAMKNKAG